MFVASPIHQILDLARWAPSGDNTQPWRFDILDDRRCVIHGHDTRAYCVYDLDGRPSQLSLGALIETMDIAASAFGMAIQVVRRANMPDTRPTLDVTFVEQSSRSASELVHAIPIRSVCRRPMASRALEDQDQEELTRALGPDHELMCFSSWTDRLRWASLLWSTAGLRLRLPEAFEVHRGVIEWHSRFSADRIPDQALGASRATLVIMRWAMKSWQRVEFLNTWLGGTLLPRVEMDLIPATACGAHIAILAKSTPVCINDYLASGRVVQRFWLTATRLGLQHQPAITPIIFHRYLREGRVFTTSESMKSSTERVAAKLESLLGASSDRAVWLGRLGYATGSRARSERKTLASITNP